LTPIFAILFVPSLSVIVIVIACMASVIAAPVVALNWNSAGSNAIVRVVGFPLIEILPPVAV
jgi:hypothetical protein